MWLTPDERRGALLLVSILLLGAGWDLWRASPRRLARGGRLAPSATGMAAHESAAVSAGIAAQGMDLRDSARVTLDLNRASAAALDALPGIGPVLAGRIVARRERQGPYRRPEDLLDVPGIGPRLLERLRPLVSAGGDSGSGSAMQSAKNRRRGRADSPSDARQTFR